MTTRAVRNNSTDKQACSYYSLLVRHFTSERVKRINKNNIQPLTTYFFDVCLHSYAAATIIFKIIFSATQQFLQKNVNIRSRCRWFLLFLSLLLLLLLLLLLSWLLLSLLSVLLSSLLLSLFHKYYIKKSLTFRLYFLFVISTFQIVLKETEYCSYQNKRKFY